MARILIEWDRESEEANFALYTLDGLSHVEAQRVLLAVLVGNYEHALAEATGKRDAVERSGE